MDFPVARTIDHLPALGAAHAPALIDRDGVLSFAALEAAVARMAGGLAALRIEPGARVATWLPKTRTGKPPPLPPLLGERLVTTGASPSGATNEKPGSSAACPSAFSTRRA